MPRASAGPVHTYAETDSTGNHGVIVVLGVETQTPLFSSSEMSISLDVCAWKRWNEEGSDALMNGLAVPSLVKWNAAAWATNNCPSGSRIEKSWFLLY